MTKVEAKHTPGPFTVKSLSIPGFSLIQWDFDDAGLPGSSLQVETEIAILWATSPSLLEVTKDVLRVIETDAIAQDSVRAAKLRRRLESQICVIIAKAENHE